MSRGGGGGKPTPGRQYVLQDDGSLEDIGVAAYGKTGQGPRIWGANPHVSATAKLKKGTVLVIPGEKPPTKLTGKAPDDLTCIIGGRGVPLLNARVMRTMDTGADGWTGSIAWTPGTDKELDRVTRPFGYERAAIYIGNTLLCNGRLYGTAPEMTERGLTKGLTGYSFTIDAVDSTVMPPYELNNVTLKQLADYYCAPMGVKAVFEGDWGGPFKAVTAHEGERIFDHLAKLASQRGGLLTNTPEGDMLFWRARTRSKPVGTLQEGGPFCVGWRANYDGRKRWHSYKIVTAGVKGREKPAARKWGSAAPASSRVLPSTITEIDELVPLSRFQTFRADEVTPGNVANAARWKRNKSFADALTIPFPVSGWHDPNGALWEVNTTVTVVSATLGVPRGFTFLVRAVEFELAEDQRSAVLYLLPPTAYSGKDLGDVWYPQKDAGGSWIYE